MSRRDSIATESWRVQVRIVDPEPRVIVEFQGDEDEARAVFHTLRQRYAKNPKSNVELQCRAAGKQRYYPVQQAAGDVRLDW
jgi:hypothetical protein